MAHHDSSANASKEQKLQAKENKQEQHEADPTAGGYDKKLNGPNRPSV
ncbi:hypothetical protein ACFQI7_28415 [Paenibacillus allorhizosphaerae]|uniref:Uncharacterized protein n=1 Tax=Paenibacillus allorhizosphaerae TaxID=2849866 RepID=A0ABN7TPC8_9BACL|nr:hypothetical protein [Paenibacillus allorhizosphaerae]CAG7649837.1 hypothetical protein PAECIP111802_04568 [Paenibacillus allorhizosphaerae]